ncbi:response regulator transcription factor [bacterium]|nr:response regulator transcription factor [bacterium]
MTNNKRLLLIEDEPSLSKVIKINLQIEGFEVVTTLDGEGALNKLDSEYFDLIILDLMLPKINGLDILQKHRLKNNTVPIIIISAKDTSSDRIKGLKYGADDYLNKPFEIEELLIRIQNLIKRAPDSEVRNTEEIISFGDNIINFSSFKAKHKDVDIELSSKEASILKLLISHEGKVVSRQDILKSVWNYDVFPSTRTVDNFIASLRKYFEVDPKNPQFIQSVRGVGYRFSRD